jgi:hypothetical protein
MLNWWAALDTRGRFFFWSAVCFVTAIAFYFASDGGLVLGVIGGGIICFVIGLFCPRDDSTKM